jgi:hypothetical protein
MFRRRTVGLAIATAALGPVSTYGAATAFAAPTQLDGGRQ